MSCLVYFILLCDVSNFEAFSFKKREVITSLAIYLTFVFLQVVIKEDGKKRELVVGLVRFLDSMDEPENLSEHTIDYCASNGRIQNSFEREETEVIQVVEGNIPINILHPILN